VKRLISAVFHVLVVAALMNALVVLLRNLRTLIRLEDESPPDPVRTPPSISVLIPARNEEDRLPRCLDTLSRQVYPDFSITVLDDESTDRTREVVECFRSRDSRITLIHGAPLPDGWAGKPWACQQLADQATGDLLLFVDADTWFAPDVLSRTVGVMQRSGAGLFSVMPRQIAVSFGERLVLPGLYMLFMCGQRLWNLEDPDHPEMAAANGQFICIPRDAYREIGGHRRVRDQVVEDIALARVVKSSGRKLVARTAIQSVYCRMYESSRAVFDGFSKNAYASFDERPLDVAGAIVVMVATHILPPLLLIRNLVSRRSSRWSIGLSAVETGLGITLRWLVSRRTGFRERDALLAHLNAVAFVVITIRSMWWRYAGGGYRWKGRQYRSAGVQDPSRQ
jgi:chlorobactene glucosyltransferase